MAPISHTRKYREQIKPKIYDRYLEINIHDSKTHNTTKKRGGGRFIGLDCDFTPLQRFNYEILKHKFTTPRSKINIISTGNPPTSGSFNTIVSVDCKNKKKQLPQDNRYSIICRFYKDFFIMKNGKIRLRTFSGEIANEKLKELAFEIQTQIALAHKGLSLHIFDVNILTYKKTIEFINAKYFMAGSPRIIQSYHLSPEEAKLIESTRNGGSNLVSSIVEKLISHFSIKEETKEIEEIDEEAIDITGSKFCLTSIMEKGKPYKITLDIFLKTLGLIKNIAALNYVCIDIKPANLLLSNDDVERPLMIDFDRKFVYLLDEPPFDFIIEKVDFGESLMIYLFCVFLLLHYSDDEVIFKDKICELLNEYIIKNYTYKGKTVSFITIITQLYNDTTLDKKLKGFWLIPIIDTYHYEAFQKTIGSAIIPFHKINDSMIQKYIKYRTYLIDNDTKAVCDEAIFHKYFRARYTVKMNPRTFSLQYLNDTEKEIFIVSMNIDQYTVLETKDKKKVENTYSRS